jgi:ubiquinone/menaquinone biosynthesis C-methylase UbiE
MIPRVLEPEVMDDAKEVAAYDAMNHDVVNAQFVEDLLAEGPLGEDCLDVGTGTALIAIELCQRNRSVRVMAMDASVAMLDLARYQLEINNLMHRVQLHKGDAKKQVFQNEYFDTVMSNSLVHHLPVHSEFLAESLRVLRPKGLLFIRDLCRPESESELESIVERVAKEDSDLGKRMLRDSLRAALDLREISELAVAVGLPRDCVTQTSDRHWTLAVRKKGS